MEWKEAIELFVTRITVIALLLISFGLNNSIFAKDEIKLASEENGRLVVNVSFESFKEGIQPTHPYLMGPGEPPLHYARFFVAVEDTQNFRVRIIDGSYEDKQGDLPQPQLTDNENSLFLAAQSGMFPVTPCIVSKPLRFRNTNIMMVDCFAEQVDYASDTKRQWSSYRIEVLFNQASSPIEGTRGDPLLSQLVINNILPSAKRPPVPAPHKVRTQEETINTFSQSDNWMKIKINKRGLFAISGGDLSGKGVDISLIDPSSFRLFTAGGITQPRSYTDSSGTWLGDNWMQECALLVRDGGDDVFGPLDSLIFYGLGNRGWRDFYQPGAPEDAHYDHPYANYNVYFLTWGGEFDGDPLRMDDVSAAPAPIPDTDYTAYRARIHYEKDLIEIFDFGDDGWFWLDVPRKTGPETIPLMYFTVEDLVASVPQEFRTVAIAPYCVNEYCKTEGLNYGHHAVYLINDAVVAEHTWDVTSATIGHYTHAHPVTATGTFLKEGTNKFTLSIPRDLNLKDFMYFAWFDVLYYRSLNALNDILAFSSPDTTGTINFRLSDFTSSGTIHLFDVTDPYHPEILSGFEVNNVQGNKREVRFSSFLSDEKKCFWASTENTFYKPFAMDLYTPTDLRNVETSPHMLIICHKLFKDAANLLKAHRKNTLPYYSNPEVNVVTTEEVFDNFSGGVPDPIAIRNYCKFLYKFTNGGGAPRLTFLLLFGDANTDYKNIASTQPDYVPTNINIYGHSSSGSGAYATDEWFVLMDLADSTANHAIPDIAVGRLPAASINESFLLTEKTIQYETLSDYHPWRGKVILVADDEVWAKGEDQLMFTYQSETIATDYLPQYIDVHRIYLTEFPFIQGIKPASRIALLKKWNEGALVLNYIGHGSSQQMADELVFLGSDVEYLQNGHRLPLFLAMSCTIGDFDKSIAKCLAEKLLLKEGGGVIGAITSSQESLIGQNYYLDREFLEIIFPDEPGPPEAVGTALILGKAKTLESPSSIQVENNQKYNLLGDPSLQILTPRQKIVFDADEADTLVAGVRKIIKGSVYRGASMDTVFSGPVHLLVREPDDLSGYTCNYGHVSYRYARGVIYRGTAEVVDGRFTFSFRVPRYSSIGPHIYLTAYAENDRRDAIVTRNTENFALVEPSSSDQVEPIDGGPRVEMGFRGGLDVVKPGAELQVLVSDPDGINILSTTNAGKQALILDDTPFPIDVTEFFSFDHGGVDTSGVLRYPLSDITIGKHKAVFKVSDSFGYTTIDTLLFTVTDPLSYAAEAVFNYPNPFDQSTHFLFRLSDSGTIHLEVFTVSGRRIRTLEKSCEAGESWVFWDGRDGTGEEIANGVYLYVAKIQFFGLDRPPVVLRGKLVKIE